MHILMIEDSEQDFNLFAAYLNYPSEAPISVKWCRTLLAGLVYLRSAQADALILDIGLPDGSGLATLETVRSQFPLLPIVIISDSDHNDHALKAVRKGAQDYLLKESITQPLLLQAVRNACGRMELLQELQQEIWERSRTEAELTRQNRNLKLLNRVIEAASTNLNVHDILLIICRELVSELDLTHATASLLAEKGDALVVVAEHTVLSEGICATPNEAICIDLRENEAAHLVLHSREPQVIVDVLDNAALSGLQAAFRERGTRSVMLIPMIVGNKAVGALVLESSVYRTFTTKEVELVMSAALALSKTLENARLYEALQKKGDTLEARVAERTEELTRAKDRVEAILNNSSEAICLVQRSTLLVEQANPAFLHMFGCEMDDILRIRFDGFAVEEDTALLNDLFALAADGHALRNIELRLKRKNGFMFDAEVSVSAVDGASSRSRFVCHVRDITERKQAERQLRYHASLQSSVHDAVISTDMAFNIQSWNPAAERIYGWTLEEVLGTPIDQVLRTNSRESTIEALARSTLLSQGLWEGEVIQLHRDGRPITILSSIVMLNDDDGNAIGIVAVNHDVTPYKQVERTAKETQQMLQLVLDTIPVRVFWKDRDLRYIGCNRQFANDAGLATPESIAGLRDTDLPPFAGPDFKRDDEDILRHGIRILDHEEAFTEADHAVVWRQVTKVPLLNADNDVIGILGTYSDITARKTAEAALQVSAANLREAQQIARLGNFEYNLATLTMTWSDELHAIAEIPPGTPLTLALHRQLMQPEDLKRTFHFVRTLRATHQPSRTEFPIILPDGRRKYIQVMGRAKVDPSGRATHIFGVAQDITERKLSEDALRQTRDQLQNVLDNSAAYIFVVDLNNRFLLANQQCEVLFGMPLEQLLDTDVSLLFTDEASDALNTTKQTILASGASCEFSQTLVVRGDEHTFMIVASPLQGADGTPYAICCVMTDITPLKQVENALRESLNREIELNELKTRFVSMASHEFRTPLATILASADSLKAYWERMSEAQLHGKLDKIRDQVLHLTDIMDDVLTLSRAQAGKLVVQRERLDLNGFCSEIIEEFHSQRGITHHIEFCCHNTPLMVHVDKHLMRKVISNLISNAIKYSPQSDKVYLDINADEGKVELRVHDTGIGIPKKDQPHLFEAFHRGANTGAIAGTGLGLAITKQAVEAHNGQIGFLSEEGKGTTFYVVIPA